MSSDYGKDEASRIRGEQEGCDGFSDTFCNPSSRQQGRSSRDKSQRTTGEVGAGESASPRGKIIGGTLGQLIEDCKGQIAGNQRIIDTLQGVNESLLEKIEYYQRLVAQIEK